MWVEGVFDMFLNTLEDTVKGSPTRLRSAGDESASDRDV